MSATPRWLDSSLETPWREDAEQLRYAPPQWFCARYYERAVVVVQQIEPRIANAGVVFARGILVKETALGVFDTILAQLLRCREDNDALEQH
ncbi:hypothetical protein TNCV_2858701 [Trichonephila clavipes]|nr:hypothetical protein TNCV_2858701 [Trichonephila clavipes]